MKETDDSVQNVIEKLGQVKRGNFSWGDCFRRDFDAEFRQKLSTQKPKAEGKGPLKGWKPRSKPVVAANESQTVSTVP